MRKKRVLLGLIMVILAIVLSICMNISNAQDDDADNGDVPLNQTKTHQTTSRASEQMVYDIDKYNLKSDKDVVLLKKSGMQLLWEFVVHYLGPVLTTIVVEVLVSIIFKVGHYKTIIVVNLLSVIMLQLVRLTLSFNYLLSFIVGVGLMMLLEYLVYKIKFETLDKTVILLYTIIANLLSTVIIFVY